MSAATAQSAPAEASSAWHRLQPCLPAMGITRIADITGLDRIGIPVMQAIRPLGLANAVSQGKGSDREIAAVSAIMEAAEQFFAERLSHYRVTQASAAALGVPAALFARHLLRDAPILWHRVETAWVEATNLISSQKGWLPLELVHTAYIEPPIPTDGVFTASTTGLACAFAWEAAVLHGLLECVERDAIARAQLTHGFFQRHRIDPDGIDDAAVQALIEQVGRAGLYCALWWAPALAEVPVVWCQIMEDGTGPLLLPHPADGFAARIDIRDAARAAIIEAAQSRLAAISGARDDVTRAAYPAAVDWPLLDTHRRLLREGPRPLTLSGLQQRTNAVRQGLDLQEMLGALLAKLSGAGLSSVLVARLDTEPCHDIVAVRVFVPELSPLVER